MSEWFDVGPVGLVAEGEVVAVAAGGKPVALFMQNGDHFALHDLCTHGQARLSDGFVEDGCIECPLHQGLFCIASGEPRSAPVTEAVRAYPVRVSGDRILVEV
ncbi:(2Fe-2S)-binding protein [Sphingobium sp. TA15]|uniref:Anthranilate dioxygenase ferredoxin n=2 Tax=Sphingobium indicum TaxID=332055 RepID=D4Z426_SPHIU|nr:non-heme iron oxygenase ferredoxin subunit [Sphingobium indicum]NYI21948.1 nitrite reductase/ring-hydroxylating ferredoxin subunit [Sphingobium indicum]RYM03294.1 non-heme iron oxygenase ferredoxin subunit [Sphingobium indicum]BAI97358.1 anthranilate dioxygenase ferredoxin [Sphingobium indicum UT26S]BDD66774.1 (2Fe-2S)-binding protein [Sphingobium sp. TA15]